MLGDTDFLYWRRRMNSGQTERITPEGVKAISRWFERSEHHRLRSFEAH